MQATVVSSRQHVWYLGITAVESLAGADFRQRVVANQGRDSGGRMVGVARREPAHRAAAEQGGPAAGGQRGRRTRLTIFADIVRASFFRSLPVWDAAAEAISA